MDRINRFYIVSFLVIHFDKNTGKKNFSIKEKLIS